MEPKKVTINYALLCKELEKQGKTKEKFSAELGRSKSFVCSMAKNPEQTEDFERTMCLLLGLEPGSLVKEPEKKGMTAAQAVIRQIKRCLFRQIKTGLSEHLTME